MHTSPITISLLSISSTAGCLCFSISSTACSRHISCHACQRELRRPYQSKRHAARALCTRWCPSLRCVYSHKLVPSFNFAHDITALKGARKTKRHLARTLGYSDAFAAEEEEYGTGDSDTRVIDLKQSIENLSFHKN